MMESISRNLLIATKNFLALRNPLYHLAVFVYFATKGSMCLAIPLFGADTYYLSKSTSFQDSYSVTSGQNVSGEVNLSSLGINIPSGRSVSVLSSLLELNINRNENISVPLSPNGARWPSDLRISGAGIALSSPILWGCYGSPCAGVGSSSSSGYASSFLNASPGQTLKVANLEAQYSLGGTGGAATTAYSGLATVTVAVKSNTSPQAKETAGKLSDLALKATNYVDTAIYAVRTGLGLETLSTGLINLARSVLKNQSIVSVDRILTAVTTIKTFVDAAIAAENPYLASLYGAKAVLLAETVVFNTIAKDPPDSNYNQVATVGSLTPLIDSIRDKIASGMYSGESQKRLEIMLKGFEAVNQAELSLIAAERVQGARAAGADPAIVLAQIEAYYEAVAKFSDYQQSFLEILRQAGLDIESAGLGELTTFQLKNPAALLSDSEIADLLASLPPLDLNTIDLRTISNSIDFLPSTVTDNLDLLQNLMATSTNLTGDQQVSEPGTTALLFISGIALAISRRK